MIRIIYTCMLSTVFAVLGFALAQDDRADINPPANAAILQGYFIDYLADNGFVPEPNAGLRIEDYVTILDTSEHPTVGVYIDENGLLTPTPAWHAFNGEYCMHYARNNVSATNSLQIEVVKLTETNEGMTRNQYYFASRNIETHTGMLTVADDAGYTVGYDASQNAGGIRNNPDHEAMGTTIPEMLDDLFANSGVAGIGDPCGDIHVEHVSGTSIGEPVHFLAGFEGGYGTHLTYEWDFGDGSAAEVLDKTPSHVYSEDGTFTVTVTVSGDAVETLTGTVDVVIGGSYALYFETTTSGNFPEGTTLRAAVEGEIPLAMNADGAFAGDGMISGTVFEGSLVAELMQLCSFTFVDGRLYAEIFDLTSPRDTIAGLRFDIQDGGFAGLPGVDLHCGAAAGMPMFDTIFGGLGKIWWPAFVGIHEPEFGHNNTPSMNFTGFNASSGDIVSSVTLVGTFHEDGMTLNQTTVMEIRKK